MRRSIVKDLPASLGVLLTIATSALFAVQGPARQPNILHIHADDFRADGIAALGNPAVRTPNLDRLVARGYIFTHCYTQGSMVGAVCLPSRTMMLTGRSWLRIRQAPPRAELLPSVIAAAGYETWHMGKSSNEYGPAISAFDVNIVDNAPGVGYGPQSRSGASRRHADAALAFLKERKTDRPFYMYLAPPVPHDPRLAEPQFVALYDPGRIPLPAAFLPLHPFDNGEMTVRDETLAPWPRTPEDTRRQLADYYACITGLDHHVGRILDQLDQSGELERTIVIFSGDNGLSLGDHGLFGKQNLYEFGGMHVPLVIAGPGIPKGKSDALVYLMDLFPTLCELTAASVPASVEGKSLLPIIQGKKAKVREVLYTAYRDCQRSLRDDRWKLIRYPLVGTTQLFDLANDPHELKNLAADPAQAARVRTMTERLMREMELYADLAPLVVAHPKPAKWTPPAQPKHATNQPGGNKTVSVFILAGQSNMEGQAVADLTGKDYNNGHGTLIDFLEQPGTPARFRRLRDDQGRWLVRNDVWVWYQPEKKPLKKGPLTLGFTPYEGRHHFGPEFQFGRVLGDTLDNPVLLIKTAWGGKSLYRDFRPPSSGGEVGPYYKKMLADVRRALANIGSDFPMLAGRTPQLSGFVWYQGWNDGIDPEHAIPEYEQNLVNLIKDLRHDLNAPRLPVVIGELTGPWVNAPDEWATLRKAQARATERPEFRGNVVFVATHDFVRKPEDSPNPSHGHHEFGNAETYLLVGDALGSAMTKLLAPNAGIR